MKQKRQINRASLEESTQRALIEHRDIEIPNELQLVFTSTSSEVKLIQAMDRAARITIDRDLLQDIRDLITLCTLIDKSGQCKEMSDKLDNIYPYLKGLKEYQRTDVTANPQVWEKGSGKLAKRC